MSKRPSDDKLRLKMNEYAAVLLDATYGPLKKLPEGDDPDTLPKADVFNAVVNWLRTDSGMEPMTVEKPGLAALAEKLDDARKR